MKLRKLLDYILFLLALWMGLHIAVTVMVGLRDTGTKADLAVILGNKVNADGTLSERLEKRLECGLQLYRDGRVKRVLVSGGLGKEGFPEGDKMKEFLVRHGVPDSLVIVDNKGDNTLATVRNTLKLEDSLHFESIIVVSQYYHILRTEKLFRKAGFQHVGSASPHYFELRDVYALLREFGAYYWE